MCILCMWLFAHFWLFCFFSLISNYTDNFAKNFPIRDEDFGLVFCELLKRCHQMTSASKETESVSNSVCPNKLHCDCFCALNYTVASLTFLTLNHPEFSEKVNIKFLRLRELKPHLIHKMLQHADFAHYFIKHEQRCAHKLILSREMMEIFVCQGSFSTHPDPCAPVRRDVSTAESLFIFSHHISTDAASS